MKPDLASLYSQLNLRPDCTLEQFQYAYRRRIADLHPDRQAEALSPEMLHSVRMLIAMHATVTRFHRRYGRMPGARPEVFEPRRPRRIDRPFRSVAQTAPRVRGQAEPSSRATLTLLFLFIALLVLLASWAWLTSRSQVAGLDPTPPASLSVRRA